MKSMFAFSLASLAFGSVRSSEQIAAQVKPLFNAVDEQLLRLALMDARSQAIMAGLGTEKISSNEVKALARTLQKDYTLLDLELTSLARSKDVELSSADDPDSQEISSEMGDHDGNSFENLLLTRLQTTHKEAVDSYEAALKVGKDADFKSWIRRTLPLIRRHLASISRLIQPAESSPTATKP